MVISYYKTGSILNTFRAKKDCQYKIHAVEKKIAQIRSHILHVDNMIKTSYEGLTNDPLLINSNTYTAHEINRLSKIREDYNSLLAAKSQELIQLNKRMELIERRMRDLRIKDERALEKDALDQIIEISIMQKKDAN